MLLTKSFRSSSVFRQVFPPLASYPILISWHWDRASSFVHALVVPQMDLRDVRLLFLVILLNGVDFDVNLVSSRELIAKRI